jgi:hypothetical protein
MLSKAPAHQLLQAPVAVNIQVGLTQTYKKTQYQTETEIEAVPVQKRHTKCLQGMWC